MAAGGSRPPRASVAVTRRAGTWWFGRKGAGLICACLMAPCVLAGQAPGDGTAGTAAPQAPASASQAEPVFTDDLWLNARDQARSSALWLARSVDSWFGDLPFEDGGEVSDGQLGLRLVHRQDRGTDPSLRFNARFRLPNVERMSYLFVGRDNVREVVTDKPGAFSRQDRLQQERPGERDFFVGLGVDLRERLDFRLGLRGGLKPYAQVRYKQAWTWGEQDEMALRQTLFWTIDDHLGSTTALSYEHVLGATLTARWLSAVTVTQEDRRFDWSSGLGLLKDFGARRHGAVELVFSGKEGTGVSVPDYGLRLRWQQPLREEWLMGELILGHFWPRPEPSVPRGRAWAVGAGLLMHF